MALVINTNVASLSAQNSMSKAQMDQNEAMERLTTGKRINTAADDAAGLAIANKMTSQVKGLNQAVRNANDGISMLQTAAGGLEESSNILQRMRELAVQSASGTYDDGNRASMNAEVEQLKAELDRISETTTFNGQNILDGSQKNTSLQVGANAEETISFSINSTASNKLGGGNSGDLVGRASDFQFDNTPAQGNNLAGNVTVNGQQVLAADVTAATTMGELIEVFEDNVAGIEMSSSVEFVASSQGDGVLATGTTMDFTVLENDGTETTFQVTETGSMDELVSAINEASAGRVEASLDDSGKLVVRADDAANIVIADNSTAQAASGSGAASVTTQANLMISADDGEPVSITYATAADASVLGFNQTNGDNDQVGQSAIASAATWSEGDVSINGVVLGELSATEDVNGSGGRDEQDVVDFINQYSAETGVIASQDGSNILTLESVDGSAIQVDFKQGQEANMLADLGLEESNATETSGSNVSSIDISTAAGAQKAIKVLDNAIEQVSAIQGELGAVNNRLDFTVSNLSNVSENASAAKSRIEDADFAAESANLSRAQVLQQASQAMLAQANSAPKQVMSLLQ